MLANTIGDAILTPLIGEARTAKNKIHKKFIIGAANVPRFAARYSEHASLQPSAEGAPSRQ